MENVIFLITNSSLNNISTAIPLTNELIHHKHQIPYDSTMIYEYNNITVTSVNIIAKIFKSNILHFSPTLHPLHRITSMPYNGSYIINPNTLHKSKRMCGYVTKLN
ncbi:hypothetical protein ES319_D12G051700v1 [Gossypium barbadense]|uniref:Uncharacterized protein n=1 Tax=Gossypium barbadense TaxID=3634 RepID=A0A5J5NUL5_GOSBA|nr:hypothetical protein ES319_D12G051700v1 [Gossypium barbadense]